MDIMNASRKRALFSLLFKLSFQKYKRTQKVWHFKAAITCQSYRNKKEFFLCSFFFFLEVRENFFLRSE